MEFLDDIIKMLLNTICVCCTSIVLNHKHTAAINMKVYGNLASNVLFAMKLNGIRIQPSTNQPTISPLTAFQTLNSISAEKNSTIIFPVPIDIITSFMPSMSTSTSSTNSSSSRPSVTPASTKKLS